MAEQKIQFTIGSIFNGEGFKQAQQAVLNTNKAVNKSAQMISLLASNVGMMDASYSKAANAVTGLLAALTSGNPYLIAAQVAMTGITFVLDKLKESYDNTAREAEAAYQKVKKARDAAVQSFSKQQQEEMKSFISELQEITKEFDRITANANKAAAAINKIDATKDAGNILQMKIDSFIDQQGSSGVDAELIKAKNDYAILLQEHANKEKYAQQAIDEADKKRTDAENKIALIDEQIASISEQRKKNDEKLARVGGVDAKLKEQLLNDNKTLGEKEKALKESRLNTEDQLAAAQRESLQLEAERKNMLKENMLARMEAEKNITDVEDKIAKQEQEDAYKRHEQYMEFIHGCEQQIEQMEQIRKQEQDDADKKHAAELKLTEQLQKELEQRKKQAEDELNKAKNQMGHGSSGGGGGGGGGGWGGGDHPSPRQQQTSDAWNNNNQARAGILDAINKFYEDGGGNRIDRRLNLQDKSIQQKVGETAKQQALNQGMSLAAANKAGRDAARAARDAASSKEGRQAAQDAKRLNDLQKKVDSGKKLSPKEEQELKDLERQKAGKEADIERAKQEAENIKNLPNNVKELKKAVDDIKKQLEKLGLK